MKKLAFEIGLRLKTAYWWIASKLGRSLTVEERLMIEGTWKKSPQDTENAEELR